MANFLKKKTGESQASGDDEDWLEDDSTDKADVGEVKAGWDVLIVDDDPGVHDVTRLAISGIEYKGRKLRLHSAFNEPECIAKLRELPDVALILLDVVMEKDDSGLRLVKVIREEMKNHLVRIVLRTGQPGQAPEQDVILSYDINDYKSKTELSVQKLFTSVIASLRSYESMVAIERNRRGLNCILEGTSNLYQHHSLKEFASGVLDQVSALLNVGTQGIICVTETDIGQHVNLKVLAATGVYNGLQECDLIPAHHPAYNPMLDGLEKQHSTFNYPHEVLYLSTKAGKNFVVYFNCQTSISEVDKHLLEIFCDRISAAFDNLFFHSQMLSALEATVIALADLAEYRDTDTGEHVLRVKTLTSLTARKLFENGHYAHILTPGYIDLLGTASILHDVGKVGTPDHVLFKPGKHDPEERRIMEQHSRVGGHILSKAAQMVEGTTYLSLGAEIAQTHHEHWDGNGYPAGLKGNDIPLSGRIVAVVDVFDALINKRPYKEPWSKEDATAYLIERKGKQFDPLVVDAYLDVIKEMD
ncbi:DUF3369 domain-containing protein [Burkholderiaceae bacterium DAT-1]|nr:DUF3369 domain-containing protein [Burkholderiaceae bacterium DAT-1]